MEDAHKLLKIPKSEVSRHLDSSTTTQMAQIMVQYGRCSRSSWKESVWSSFGRTFMEKAIWEDPFEAWLGENSKLSLCTSWKRIILICVCGSHQIGWKEQNIDPMWKVLNKEVDLEEPTSLLDHQDLGCTQRQCQISKDIVGNYRTMFKSWISARRTEKLSSPQNLDGLYVMEGHVKKCVERYCELANKSTQQLYQVSIPCWRPFSNKNWNPWDCSQLCSRAISCSNVHCVIPSTSSSDFIVVQVSATHFVVSQLSHGTCERRNKRSGISGGSFCFEYGFS